MILRCSTCQTRIDPDERCPAERGLGQCMEKQGHEGWHWSDIGRGDGSVLIWTGHYSRQSCPGRIDLFHWCIKPAGHEDAHNGGRGVTWLEDEAVA